MKILVLSLLRLGDIIMQEPLFTEIKSRYPQAELHVLINEQFLKVKNIVPQVDQWVGFPRNELQQLLVQNPSAHQLAFAKLSTQISSLNHQGYDIIFNFTHNFLSARLMDQLQCQDKRGLQYKEGVKVPSQNFWQAYMNDNFTQLKGSKYHYIEVLAGSMGLDTPKKPLATVKGTRRILVQLFTSDQKKNWQIENFRTLIHNLVKDFPNHQVQALCSSDELQNALNYFSADQIISPELAELKQILAKTDLLISGDTSVQHLAATQGCRVLSLFMGSADAIKTSAWQLGGYTIEGVADCYPCSHSKPCVQATHICGRSIKVEKVLIFAKTLLAGNGMEKLHGRSEQDRAQELNC